MHKLYKGTAMLHTDPKTHVDYVPQTVPGGQLPEADSLYEPTTKPHADLTTLPVKQVTYRLGIIQTSLPQVAMGSAPELYCSPASSILQDNDILIICGQRLGGLISLH